MITDMTTGSPTKILWRFSIPLLLSVAFQQFYNMADSIVAGRYAGDLALAAVGASYPITMLFMAVATGMNLGASVVVSQLFGAHEHGRMKTAVWTSLLFTGGLAAALTVFGLLATGAMMRAIETPAEVFADAALYLRIYIGGLLFLFLYNICTGVFTALGDSRTPLLFLIASSLGNILLDVVFVAGFHWGVAGVAWATFIAQGVSAVLALVTLLHRLHYVPCEDGWDRFSIAMLGRIMGVAVPSIAQQSFISVGNVIIQYLVNQCGADVVAGYSAAIKLNTLTITGLTALASGISSFSAQNIGAGKLDRVSEGFRAGVRMSVAVAAALSVLYFVAAEPLMGLFVSDGGSRVVTVGVGFLRIVAPFYAVICLKLTADGVLRGAGAMKAFMVATFSDLIIRCVLSIIFCGWWRETGIWLSWPVGWTIGTAFSLLFYFRGVWKRGAEKAA